MAVALPTELQPIAGKAGLEPTTYCLVLKIAELILNKTGYFLLKAV